ncbi:MAG: DNA repair protein RadA [Lachnospiraceae bacterium]|nr:DNA repair protein RadA [Lachnospiraceae bacterium]
MAGKVKNRTVFFCQECGYESPKWLGQCPMCHKWNSMVEERVTPSTSSASVTKSALDLPKPQPLSSIEMEETDKLKSGILELDRVLGGGIVQGSMVLVGGDPGIGKSTLLLQAMRNISAKKLDVLYVSGEESLKQIKLRAMRLGEFNDYLKLLPETRLDRIQDIIEETRPMAVVIDSIQTLYSETVSSPPGSVSQVREATGILLRIAKSLGITVFIIGHVTKEGAVAGPRVLEHMVDTVLYFEGDGRNAYRILRAVKNRFGSTDEIGVFEMHEDGLHEVENPSEFLLSGRLESAPGSIVTCCMEGTRPLLLEIQALIADNAFGFPRRQAAGTDHNRVSLLMAVMEKRAGMRLSSSDAYINIAGGIKATEPAVDLGIVMAIASSFRNRPISHDTVAFGEVGLSGEVRAVSDVRQRINEAKRLGFKRILMPKGSLKNLKSDVAGDLSIAGIRTISEALEEI